MNNKIIIDTETPFLVYTLAEKYSNVRLVKEEPQKIHYTFHKENGNFLGDLFYFEEERNWIIIIDNFPSQRKRYDFNLPVKTFEIFEFLLKQIKVELTKRPLL